ncbi:MAG: YceD family protein, partial [Longimicrobiales bacterium]
DDAMWMACQPAELALGGPVEVQLEAQRVGSPRDACRVGSERVGYDVVVRGTLAGMAELPCRRCLAPVPARFDEDVMFMFRVGLDPREAEDEETYAMPPRARTIDLTDAVREHVLLGVPRFALCKEGCRGICPHCGKNLNHGTCDCARSDVDERWAALRRWAQG